ncbi:hypothetical protein ACOQFB_02980 [Anaeromyxobacter sp. Red801]
MVSLAILTALSVDLAYETRVRLQIAVNGRDELRATYLAKSAVSFSRLVLAFQQQIDQASGAACQAFGALAGGAGGGTATGTGATGTAGAGGQAAGGACPRPQIWELVPVSSGLVQALFGEAGPAAQAAAEGAPPQARFGDFEGGFASKIEDEGRKVNVQLDALQTSGLLGPQVEAILRLVCDARWDPLFDREDADGQRWTRNDLLLHLRDWVDDDEAGSALAVSYPGGDGCTFVVPANPFEKGFSDENRPYDHGRDRYRAKNARFDSLAELSLVAGVSDAFLAAFGDRLTVYLPREARINVNTSDASEQMRIAWMMADPAAQPLLLDPAFPQKLQRALSDVRMGGLMALTPPQFAAVVAALGVPVRADYLTQNPKSPFTDRSAAFRIRAFGNAGAVSKTIDAVVTFDPNQNQPAGTAPLAGTAGTAPAAGTPAAGNPLITALQGQAGISSGRLIHWREE